MAQLSEFIVSSGQVFSGLTAGDGQPNATSGGLATARPGLGIATPTIGFWPWQGSTILLPSGIHQQSRYKPATVQTGLPRWQSPDLMERTNSVAAPACATATASAASGLCQVRSAVVSTVVVAKKQVSFSTGMAPLSQSIEEQGGLLGEELRRCFGCGADDTAVFVILFAKKRGKSAPHVDYHPHFSPLFCSVSQRSSGAK
jgi:hypothetical protein